MIYIIAAIVCSAGSVYWGILALLSYISGDRIGGDRTLTLALVLFITAQTLKERGDIDA